MKTFFGKFYNNNFVYSNDNESLRAQLISILNTPIGTRFYAPSYGSNLRNYKFSVLNYYTINMIAQEVKNAVHLLEGVSLSSLSFYVNGNSVNFILDLNRSSESIRVALKVVDGVAS